MKIKAINIKYKDTSVFTNNSYKISNYLHAYDSVLIDKNKIDRILFTLQKEQKYLNKDLTYMLNLDGIECLNYYIEASVRVLSYLYEQDLDEFREFYTSKLDNEDLERLIDSNIKLLQNKKDYRKTYNSYVIWQWFQKQIINS